MNKKKIILFVFVCSGMLFAFSSAYACKPMNPVSFDDSAQYIDLIFVGRMVDAGPKGSTEFGFAGEPEWVKIKVSDPIKGNLKYGEIIKVKTNSYCEYGFPAPAMGSDYLMFLDSSSLVDSSKTRIRLGTENIFELKNNKFSYYIESGSSIKKSMTLNEFKQKYGFADDNNAGNNLKEGQTYTVKELDANTSAIARKFFTEAYVIHTTLTAYPPNSSSNFIINKVVISDDKSYEVTYPLCAIGSPCPPVLTNKQTELAVADRKYNRDLFQLKKKYRFEVSAHNTSNTNIPKNDFTLVSVKNIDGSVVVSETTTPPITDQPAKKSFFGRIWNWFAGLFKR